MSSRKFSAREARRAKMAYRATFKEKWRDFVRSEFESPAEVAHEFGCDPSTAEGWFEGHHAPAGPFVGYAFREFPERAFAYLAGSIA